MLRTLVVGLLISRAVLWADDPKPARLTAPDGWAGETIELPPGFAPDMKLKGVEQIKFAPGMMKPDSDSFFSYAFVFELQPEPALTEAVIREELLTYYRGLCKAVLNGKLPDVDFSKFTLTLEKGNADTSTASKEKDAAPPAISRGVLDWVEPFATKKSQKLNLEIQTWTGSKRQFVFVCVSPLPLDNAIWKQLHTIRDDYLKSNPPRSEK